MKRFFAFGLVAVVGTACVLVAQSPAIPTPSSQPDSVPVQGYTIVGGPGEGGMQSNSLVQYGRARTIRPSVSTDVGVRSPYSSDVAQWIYRDPTSDKLTYQTEEQMNDETRKLHAEFQHASAEAVQTLRSNTADATKKAAAKKLIEEELHVRFKIDLEHRQASIKAIEKNLNELKEQVAKRASSEDKLVSLRLELMENETNGLEFPGNWNGDHLFSVPGFPNVPAATWQHSYPSSPSYAQPSSGPGAFYFPVQGAGSLPYPTTLPSSGYAPFRPAVPGYPSAQQYPSTVQPSQTPSPPLPSTQPAASNPPVIGR